ncbi:hypothetical protein B0T25DRAFT_493679 [Lasiosphaeria hispida]|uniref:Digeranylgeranylglyceryl phosphate synthase n=1 Tax=Lasiosphaeria hispida TaxID=260671 RepID=A0AAJ0MLJ0_9PEZI|nr:hypothetical protein B0T25DRAFT_493679 [Lasiosphaeria hispida]
MLYHAYTLWLFTYSSHKDTVYPSVAFALSTALSPSIFPFTFTPPRLPLSILWTWLALLFFSLHNQHAPASVLEDAINKPWRPLPSKRITTRQTHAVLAAVYPVWLGFSLHLGAIKQCLGLTVLTWYYCEFGGGEQGGFARNALNALGYSCFFAGALQVLVGPADDVYTGKALGWLVVVSLIVFSMIHAQDFRDEEGDGLRGRTSVATAVGDRAARWMIVAAAGFWSVVVPAVLGLGVVVTVLLGGVAAVLSGYILRHLGSRTLERDVVLYKLFLLWFIFVIFSPLIQTSLTVGGPWWFGGYY